jgi:predicted nucleic acid-binding protein
MTTQVYISDTNIWIDFRNAGLLDALFSLPFKLSCTDFVLNELKDFDSKHLLARGLVVETLDAAATATLFDLMQAHNNSSLADVSCYQLAKQTGRPLLTGDGRLRKQAMADGLQVHGALWLLDQMVAHQIIPPKNAAKRLQSMLTSGARLPEADCQKRLTLWAA